MCHFSSIWSKSNISKLSRATARYPKKIHWQTVFQLQAFTQKLKHEREGQGEMLAIVETGVSDLPVHSCFCGLFSCCSWMFTVMTQTTFIILPQMTTKNMKTCTNCWLILVCITKVSHPDLKSVYRAWPCRPRSHLSPNVVTPLFLCASICLFLTTSPLATAGLQTIKKNI